MENMVRVLSTLALRGAVQNLAGPYEAAGGARIEADFAPTLGLLDRLHNGEETDVVIVTREGLDGLAAQGSVVAASCVDLARSYVGLAVKAGADHPDIAEITALRTTLVNARAVAYSRIGASGIFFAQLIERMGIAPEINARAIIVPQGLTAERLVSGEADLAVQQLSELMQVRGVEVVGPIPRELQAPAVFSAGRLAASSRAVRADALLAYLASAEVAPVLRAAGLEPRIRPFFEANLAVPMCAMTKRSHALVFAAIGCVAVSAIAIVAAPGVALAQSADLVLCDRLAADPADPDKPADVKGTPEVAASDIATAIKFCKIAAGSSRRALYQLGRAYAANHQLPEAIVAWRKAADKGSSSAMVELGVLYGTGAGVARDDAQARKLFERAAQAGNPRGISNLAALGGGGASSDPARARELLAKAAETNAEAQYQLGLMLADGSGGAQDDAGARALFEKAAAQNHPGALERMGAFTQQGRGGPKDAAAAKAYYERAVALGDEDAKKALKHMECPYVIKDKRGNFVTNLCF